MSLDENTIKRLVFIKYMYENAVEQSKKAYPESQMSLLAFHDSIELFLYLAYQKVGGSKNPDKVTFLGYWDEIQGKLKKELTQKISISKLDRARANLKHHGILISEFNIEEFRVSSRIFFKENTELVFDIQFSELSLTDLVQNESVKIRLKESEKMLKDGDLENAVKEIAIAFAQLMYENESRVMTILGKYHPLFENQMDLKEIPYVGHGYDDNPVDDMADAIIENFYNLEYSLTTLQETVKLLSLGVNYYDYMKFRTITPHINIKYNKKTREVEYYMVDSQQRTLGKIVNKREFNNKQTEFCLDFVIKTAMALQELDFDSL